MNRILVFALAALTFALPGLAQDPAEIRDVEIDTQSAEGSILTSAGVAEEREERVGILEGFVNDFPESPYLGYALLQLQTNYVALQNHEKTVETGHKLLKIVPEDVEVRHNVNQALVALQRWDDLKPALLETRPLAERDAAAPPPEDPDVDEDEIYQSGIDYANGVVQYVAWAMNVGMGQQTDPMKKIEWMDTMREQYPDSDNAKGLEDQYVIAYQQMGDMAGMKAAIGKALEVNPGNEQYIYTLIEMALNEKDFDSVNARGEELIKLMEEKPAPEGTDAEDWEATKAKYTALANYSIGNGHFQKGAWRTSRSHLLKTVDHIKAEGGQRYGLLSYMLGFCYVKLDIAGDNIRQATFWLKESAGTASPVQEQAKTTLTAVLKAR